MNNYAKFYLTTGVIKPKALKNPKITSIASLNFPKGTFLHHATIDPDAEGYVVGVDEGYPFFANIPKTSKIIIEHQLDFDEDDLPKDSPVTRKTLQKMAMVKEYHRQHPTFIRGFIDTSKSGNVLNVILKNHTLAGCEYTYVKQVLSRYHQFHDYWKSVFKDIEKSAANSTRQHFIPIEMPKPPPSRNQMNKWLNESKESNWKLLKTQERFLFAEFYAWLGFASDTIIPSNLDALDRINGVFHNGLFCFVVNLGKLRRWVIDNSGVKVKDQVLGIEEARRLFLLATIKLTLNTVREDTDDFNSLSEDELELQDAEDLDDEDYDLEVDDDSSDVNALSDDEQEEVERSELKALYSKDKNTSGALSTIEELMNIRPPDIGNEPKKLKRKKLSNNEPEQIKDEEVEEEEAELDALEELNESIERTEESIEIQKVIGYQKYVPQEVDLSTTIDEQVETIKIKSNKTTAELRRLKTIGRKWEDIKDPRGTGMSAPEIIDIKLEDYKLAPETRLTKKKVDGVFDESMLNSSIKEFNRKYVKEVMPRHSMAVGLNLQRAGVCVTDYKVNRFENAFDDYEIHSFKLIPLEGGESTIKFKLPVVQEDGSFMAGGVKSKCRLQRIDIPIRKISYWRVQLLSYVSKFFVSRSQLVAYSQEKWLEKKLIGLSNDNPAYKINFADCYKFDIKAPIKYTELSRVVSKIETDDYILSFDYNKASNIFGADLIREIEKSTKNQVVIGKMKKENSILIMAEDNSVFKCSTESVKDMSYFGTIESMLGLDVSKSPVDMLVCNISGKELPVALVLGYYLGFGNFLETIGAKFRRAPRKSRITIEDHEFTINFADESLIFDRRDYKTSIFVGGLRQIKDVIKNYSVYALDIKDTYGSIFMDLKISSRYTKELDLMRDLWIDPITRDVLKSMNETTDFVKLIIRAGEMLTVDLHEQTRDEKGFRLRGYERFNGFAYKEMVAAVRAHNNKPSKANSKIEINPQAVWMKILQDQTTAPVEDSNPIHSLKESEVVVYRGQGGQDARTLNSESRKYHANSIGIISDATVDNGDAGTVVYLTADPNIDSVLGTTRVIDEKERKSIPATKLLPTSTLLAPMIEFDD